MGRDALETVVIGVVGASSLACLISIAMSAWALSDTLSLLSNCNHRIELDIRRLGDEKNKRVRSYTQGCGWACGDS